MIQLIVQALLWVFVGVLIGEIPTGRTTFGRTAWEATRSVLRKGGEQAQSLVTYAGLQNSTVNKWLGKVSQPAPKPAPVPAKRPAGIDKDPEGLTPTDREALRQILE